MARLWDKGGDLDRQVLEFTVGEDHRWDARLVPHDVRASIGHARMLHEQGYLSADDLTVLTGALESIGEAHARGEWEISIEEEDVHTALEGRLVEQVGEVGERIHLGRSRNDQVLAALRLYLKDAVETIVGLGEEVVGALDEIVAGQGDCPLPGYTHLQRAMPSSVAQWAGAFRTELEDDLAGVSGTLRRIDKNPLGSAAGYGVPVVKIDRERTAELLGFGAVHEPVTAVQLSRGKAEASLVFELSLLMQDIGRLASDLCLYATEEFGFVRLPARFTTGSSIMPQKRNPDVLELLRGRAAQFAGYLPALLSLTSKLPSGYHRDLQLLKEPLFRAIDGATESLAILGHVLPGIEFVRARTEAAIDPTLFATESAYRRVEETGVPFRTAYREVAAELRRRDPA